MKTTLAALPMLVLSMILAACGSSGRGGSSGGGDGPVYLLGTNVFSDAGTTGYAVYAATLDEDRQLNLDRAAEFAGGVQLFGDGTLLPGMAFIGDSESPVVRRYRVDRSGGLTPDGEVSFENQGLAAINLRHEHIQFVSATKAYLFSSDFGEVVVWNPTTMEIQDTISIDGLTMEDSSSEFGYVVFRRGHELVTTYNSRASDFYAVRSRSVLVVLDTETDEVTTDVLEGCGEMTLGTQTPNGDIYFATGVHGVSVHRTTPDLAPEPCLRRVLASEQRFDPSFAVDTRELAGGRPAGDLVGGPDGSTFIRVYHEDVAPLASGDDGFAMRRKAGWRWWSADVEAGTATELTDSPFGAGNTLLFRVDGEAYLLRLAANFSSSTLELVRPGEAPLSRVTVPGVLQGGVVRVH